MSDGFDNVMKAEDPVKLKELEQLDALLASLGGPVAPVVQQDDGKPKDLYDDIEAALPAFFTRAKAVECLNGLFTLNSLNHITTRPEGPPIHYVGRKVVLRRDEFVQWLREHNRRMYGDDIEGDGRGVRRPTYQKSAETKNNTAPENLANIFDGLDNE